MTSSEDWRAKRNLVLVALLEGQKSASDIASRTGLQRFEVEATLLSLAASGLVREQEVKGLFTRKTVYSLTELGTREAEAAKRELEKVAEEIRSVAERGDVEGLQSLLASYQLLLPMLLNLHLIDLFLLQGLGYAPADDLTGELDVGEDAGAAEF
ncbi:MAG: hypothetical protein NZ957_03490 [Thaumarchaeota archaeon]|nr:hypothetical protein [Candidatus Calditenuaceae archaeon]MDW8042424.1 hypothetical protein [Nitrososphaerota archaeon]